MQFASINKFKWNVEFQYSHWFAKAMKCPTTVFRRDFFGVELYGSNFLANWILMQTTTPLKNIKSNTFISSNSNVVIIIIILFWYEVWTLKRMFTSFRLLIELYLKFYHDFIAKSLQMSPQLVFKIFWNVWGALNLIHNHEC